MNAMRTKLRTMGHAAPSQIASCRPASQPRQFALRQALSVEEAEALGEEEAIPIELVQPNNRRPSSATTLFRHNHRHDAARCT